MDRLSDIFFTEKQKELRVLPDNCVKCGVELTAQDYCYLCDICFGKDYAKRKRLQGARVAGYRYGSAADFLADTFPIDGDDE